MPKITQHERLLDCLRDKENQGDDGWVALPCILSLYISQYGRVINDLRNGKALDRRAYDIENRREVVEGKRHSWFRLNEATQYSSQMKMAGMKL